MNDQDQKQQSWIDRLNQGYAAARRIGRGGRAARSFFTVIRGAKTTATIAEGATAGASIWFILLPLLVIFILTIIITSSGGLNAATTEGSLPKTATSPAPKSGALSRILPPTTDAGIDIETKQKSVAKDLKNNFSANLSVYRAAADKTGTAWETLAAIHYREANFDPNTSLISGREIGKNEPDILRSGGCGQIYKEGLPVNYNGSCIFKNLLDSAIYAGNILKNKNGGDAPTSFQDLVKAFSRYNGGGNSNCGEGVPYQKCPRAFEGEDDPYAMNFFDNAHKTMFIIFCQDLVRCSSLVPDERLGAAAVVMALNNYYNR